MHDMAVTRDRVAEQLLELRRLHGSADKLLPQEEAARRADVGYREWQRWETRRVTPTAKSLGKVAEAFGIALDSFDDGAPEKSRTPLADRLDRIEALLTAIAERVGVDPALVLAEAAVAEGEALVAAPPGAERTPAAT